MMMRILRSTAQCPLDHRIVVTRHQEVESMCRAAEVPSLLHDLPKRSDTVRLGVQALLDAEPGLDGILFTASDQPCLKAISIQSLCEAFEAEPKYIYRLSWQGAPSNPVMFPRSTFEDLLNLPEGKGGGAVVKAHPELVRLVEATDEREIIDCDTPEILQSLL